MSLDDMVYYRSSLQEQALEELRQEAVRRECGLYVIKHMGRVVDAYITKDVPPYEEHIEKLRG